MPVRIYDIAKKHGIESKDVLAKAKELGISTARVPSSTLDKITAEYLEQHLPALKLAVPAPAAPPPPPPPPAPVAEQGPVLINSEAPPEETPPAITPEATEPG